MIQVHHLTEVAFVGGLRSSLWRWMRWGDRPLTKQKDGLKKGAAIVTSGGCFLLLVVNIIGGCINIASHESRPGNDRTYVP